MHFSRIIALKDLISYPGRDTLETVLSLPTELRNIPWPPTMEHLLASATLKVPLRFWIKTNTRAPILYLDEDVFVPKRVVSGVHRWIDMGIVKGLRGGFRQLRIKNMSPSEAVTSFLIITNEVEVEFAGDMGIEEAERQLFGVSRSDAGSTMIIPSKVPVGRPVTFTLFYFAGHAGLPPGSRIRFTVPLAFDKPQADSPSSSGFTKCESLNLEYEIVIEEISLSHESHEAIDIFCLLPEGLPPCGGIKLMYRTSKTYIFPCQFFETERKYWYSKVPPLSAAIAVDERRLFVPVANGHSIEFVPGPPERLHLFLPGRRHEGSRIVLKGIWTDKYRNYPPTKGPIPNVELVLLGPRGEVKLDDPAQRFSEPYRFDLLLPHLGVGVYRVVAKETTSGEVLTISNPVQILPSDSSLPDIYWGEIHAHTEQSDGCGNFSDLYRKAKDVAGLDFSAAADHACYFTDNEWELMQDITNHWNVPGKFVTLVGYEWAGLEGHRCIYTSRDRLELYRGMYPPTGSLKVLQKAFGDDEEVAIGLHATLAKGHELIWDHRHAIENFIEIYSMWGSNESHDTPYLPKELSPHGVTANELLLKGARMGFTGGGDCHHGLVGFSSEDTRGQGVTTHTLYASLVYRCGLTAAFLKALTRKELIQALRTGRTFATTGARILLEVNLCGVGMGKTICTSKAVIELEIHACSPIKEVCIVKDGSTVFKSAPNRLDVKLSWTDPEPVRRQHYYYARVMQIDGHIAWSSPIFVMPLKEEQTKVVLMKVPMGCLSRSC